SHAHNHTQIRLAHVFIGEPASTSPEHALGERKMLEYFNSVSIFDHSAVALFLILGANWAFTLIHVLQEWKGEKVPLWRVFGAIVGLLPFVGGLAPYAGVGTLGALIGALRRQYHLALGPLLLGLSSQPGPF